MVEQSYYEKADAIIEEHGAKPSALIPIIQDIQSEYRYLPPELLSYVADKIGITEAKAYGVATFYAQFFSTFAGLSYFDIAYKMTELNPITVKAQDAFTVIPVMN